MVQVSEERKAIIREQTKQKKQLSDWRKNVKHMKNSDHALWRHKNSFVCSPTRRISIFKDKRLSKMYDPVNDELITRYAQNESLEYIWVGRQTNATMKSGNTNVSWIDCRLPCSLLRFLNNDEIWGKVVVLFILFYNVRRPTSLKFWDLYNSCVALNIIVVQ